MLMISLILVQITLAVNASEGTIDLFNHLNDHLQNPLPAQICLEDETPLNINLQCATELCGTPKDIGTVHLMPFNLKKYYDKERYQQILKVVGDLNPIIDHETKVTLQALDDLSARIQNPDFLQLGKSGDFSEFAEFLLKDYFSLEIDYALPIAERVKVVVQKEGLSEDLIKGINLYAKDYIKNITKSNAGAFQNQVITEEELKQKPIQDNGLRYSECGDIECQKAVQHFFNKKSILSKIDELKKDLTSTKYKAKRLNDCKSRFAQASLKKAINRFDEKEARHKFVNTLRNYYSSETVDNYERYLNTIKFEAPKIHEFSSSDFHSFKSNLKKTLNTNYRNEDFSTFKLYTSVLNYASFDDRIVPMAFSCMGDNGNILTDHFLPKEHVNGTVDKVNLSPFTCHHPEKSEGVIFHELAHSFSWFLNKKGNSSTESYQKFIDGRKCVSSIQKNQDHRLNTNLHHKGDTFQSEEDFADYLGNLVPATDKIPNFCYLLDPSLDGTSFERVTFEKHGNNPHSSVFYRLLAEAFVKKMNLPNSCLKVLEMNKSKFEFKKCL